LIEEDLNLSEKICDTKKYTILRAKLVAQNLVGLLVGLSQLVWKLSASIKLVR
jgi:hypothetical protein